MYVKKPRKQFYIRKLRFSSKTQVIQMSIIFVFIFISTLISILLPIYFALLPLHRF